MATVASLSAHTRSYAAWAAVTADAALSICTMAALWRPLPPRTDPGVAACSTGEEGTGTQWRCEKRGG